MNPIPTKVDKFDAFYSRLLVSFAATLVLTGCSKSSPDKIFPRTGDAIPSETISIGQQVSYEASSETLTEKVGDYPFGNATKYILSVPEQMTVGYKESMASTMCLDPYNAYGPYVTLLSSDGTLISSDKVKHGDAAVSSFDVRKDLAAGDYEVIVTFYADGESCGANLDFTFEKIGSNVSGPLPTPGPTPSPTPGIDDSPIAFDSGLIGNWVSTESDGGFTLQHSFNIKADKSAVQIIKVNQDVYLDHDLAITPIATANFKRFNMRVTGVRIDETDEPTSVGTEFSCIYQLIQSNLNLNCQESSEGFPDSFVEGVVFSKGTAPDPVPNPIPTPGSIVKSFTDINLAIPDSVTAGVFFPIEISEDIKVNDITLHLDLSHTYVGDLRVRLQHPNGTIVLVREPAGGSQTDLSITYGTGFVLPDGDFSTFDDLSAAGTWNLIISDEASDDIGKLNAVTFTIN